MRRLIVGLNISRIDSVELNFCCLTCLLNDHVKAINHRLSICYVGFKSNLDIVRLDADFEGRAGNRL